MTKARRETCGDSRGSGRSDAELIAACRRGRRSAFGELVERYQDRVFNLAYRLTGHHDDASDAAQETFLKAFRALDSFRGDCAFYTWLFRITVNAVRSKQRFRAVRPVERSLDANPGTHSSDHGEAGRSRRAELAAPGPDPVEEASRAEHRRLVEQALARLDPDFRTLIVLRDLEGRNYTEIADLLDCPRGTVKSRLHRARLALRDLLAPVFAGPLNHTGELPG